MKTSACLLEVSESTFRLKAVYLLVSLWLALMALASSREAIAAEPIVTWTYHDFPPFIIDAKKSEGLTFDLVDMLNRRFSGKYAFNLIILPKKRLDSYLQDGEKGIVLWAPSLAFGGVGNPPYAWTSALLEDRQDFLSLKKKPVDYDGKASSLFPYKLGGILGHNYFGIQDEINKGEIKREDASSDWANIQKLLAERVDFISIAHSSANYYVGAKNLTGIHFSNMPLNSYTRNILLQSGMSGAQQALNGFIEKLPNDKEWKGLLAKYSIR